MKRYISEIEVDKKEEIILLVTSIEEGQTAKGEAFCTVHLCDGKVTIGAKLWNHSKEQLLEKMERVGLGEKQLILGKLYPKMYKDSLSYELFSYDRAPMTARREDYIVSAPYSSIKMYDNILNKLKEIKAELNLAEKSLLDIAIDLYESNKEKILYWSAAKSMHHNYYGGWLYHNYRMMYNAISLSTFYSLVDKELLIAAVVLHDIGKLIELDTDELGVSDYSVKGNLFGHHCLGIEMIDEYVFTRKEELSHLEEKIMLLKHCIAAHHMNREWGAVEEPRILEAALLHYIDNIDAKATMFESAYAETEGGCMSNRRPGLPLVYKPTYI